MSLHVWRLCLRLLMHPLQFQYIKLWPGHHLINSAQVSHVWESREHADPHGYQLRKLAEVVEADAWYFYDYMSLYQFKRNVASQEKSFRRAMANMHVLYAHEEMHMDATVLVYHAPSDEVKPVPVADLIANQTAYITGIEDGASPSCVGPPPEVLVRC